MSVKDEKRMATTEMRMVRWAMGVSLLEHRRNEEILEEAKVEAIATVMRRRRLQWFGHVKRRGETENIRAVAEMKIEGKRPRGRPKLRWKDTIRRDLSLENWATDRVSLQDPLPRTWRRRRKVEKDMLEANNKLIRDIVPTTTHINLHNELFSYIIHFFMNKLHEFQHN